MAAGQGHRVLFTSVHGKLAPGSQRDVTHTTRYDVGALTQVMATVPLLLHALETGMLSLDDPLSMWLENVPEDKRELASRLISDFPAISVREPDGLDIVSELTSRKPTWVLDPSLLLPKEEYHKLSKLPKKKGYVYLYLRQESPRLEAFAQKLAKAYGLTIIKVRNNWLYSKGGRQSTAIGPHQWLGYIENADFVVTNSFHGICFSTIFEKEFFVDFLENTTNVTNSRLEGMLKQFNFKNRCIDDVEDIHSLPRIDYSDVNEFKQRRIDESLTYLKNALEGSI